jgi:glycosyltransferase involved in cell wall biosynthesis
VASTDAPLRVLHVHAGNLYGGVETMLITLIQNRQLFKRLEPRFALCFEGRFSDELTALGARPAMIGAVRARFPWTVWRARRALRALITREPCDLMVCHSAWSHTLFAPVGRRAGVPLVYWLHGVVEHRAWPELRARFSTPDHVRCNSRFTAASLPRLFPGAPFDVYYAPVSPPTNDGKPARPEHGKGVREALGAKPDDVVILQVGRMEPLKGHDVLIDALSRLKTDGRWTCWIAGGAQRDSERPYQVALAQYAAQLGIAGRVRFLGERTDVQALLAACDIVCQPNTGPEGFCRVFIEALYDRRPVVTSDLGAAPEVVDASCGVLVPPGDAQRLADALNGLIGDPARRAALGAAGPARARGLCDPETQLPALERILASVARAPIIAS